jgi:hypothetical protein
MGRCSARNVWLWLHYFGFQPSRQNIMEEISETTIPFISLDISLVTEEERLKHCYL